MNSFSKTFKLAFELATITLALILVYFFSTISWIIWYIETQEVPPETILMLLTSENYCKSDLRQIFPYFSSYKVLPQGP